MCSNRKELGINKCGIYLGGENDCDPYCYAWSRDHLTLRPVVAWLARNKNKGILIILS
jgi:hypothetical protein